jgi:hypothetical protein
MPAMCVQYIHIRAHTCVRIFVRVGCHEILLCRLICIHMLVLCACTHPAQCIACALSFPSLSFMHIHTDREILSFSQEQSNNIIHACKCAYTHTHIPARMYMLKKRMIHLLSMTVRLHNKLFRLFVQNQGSGLHYEMQYSRDSIRFLCGQMQRF